MAEVRKGWSTSPIGFRDARLESSHFSAAMALVVAGIPALLVGAELVSAGLDFAQLIIAVPLGAIIGGAIIGLLGRQAAASAAPGAFLFKAPLGSLGALLFNLARLVVTLAWAVLVLDIASGWVDSALADFGLSAPPYLVPAVIATLAVVMFANGFAWSLDFLRRRMFLVGIGLTLIVVWRLLNRSDPVGGVPVRGGFLEAVDAVLGLAILWSAVGADAGGHGQREDDTASGLALGYAVATLAFVLAGASLTRGGGLDAVTSLGGGIIGAALLLLWVPVMEVDGAGSLLASSTVSLQAIVRPLPAVVGLPLVGAATVVGAELLSGEVVRLLINIGTLVVAPALAVLLVDSLVIRPGGYRSDDLFRWRGDYGLVNLRAIAAWLVGIALGLWLRPDLGLLQGGLDGTPALLIGMAASAVVYWPLAALGRRRQSLVYGLRRF